MLPSAQSEYHANGHCIESPFFMACLTLTLLGVYSHFEQLTPIFRFETVIDFIAFTIDIFTERSFKSTLTVSTAQVIYCSQNWTLHKLPYHALFTQMTPNCDSWKELVILFDRKSNKCETRSRQSVEKLDRIRPTSGQHLSLVSLFSKKFLHF